MSFAVCVAGVQVAWDRDRSRILALSASYCHLSACANWGCTGSGTYILNCLPLLLVEVKLSSFLRERLLCLLLRLPGLIELLLLGRELLSLLGLVLEKLLFLPFEVADELLCFGEQA